MIRVAVYARVSTSKSTQELSLESQMAGFACMIEKDPGMVLTEVYADDGITGTSARKRARFLQMIEDAHEHRFDTVMTRSISRFARNTVECLSYVRELSGLGINVIFQKEGIDTASVISEMLLTVLAAFAQEESRSISENLKWSIRKRFEAGEVRWIPTYGFRKDEGARGGMAIEPAEAAIVLDIFESYRRGETLPAIAERLNDAGILSPRGGMWSVTGLRKMLCNEKYVGDIRLQKYITTDHLTHICVANDGISVPAYYIRDHHAGIVGRRTFEQVQRIMELRSPRGANSRYPYEDTEIVCPVCGRRMVTRLLRVQSSRKAVCCFGGDGCHGFAVRAKLLDAAILRAFSELQSRNRAQSHSAPVSLNANIGAPVLDPEYSSRVPESVEYYFLQDYVKRISFIRGSATASREQDKDCSFGSDYETEDNEAHRNEWDVVVEWTCGEVTSAPLDTGGRMSDDPIHAAELYERFLQRNAGDQ